MDFTKVTVAEIMSRGVITVGMEAKFEEVLQALTENKVHAVVVTGPGGEFMGVISHSDIIEALAQKGPQVFNTVAEDIMCPKPYTIEGTATLKEAAAKMVNYGVHRLLVLSSHGGKLVPVGVLSAIDLVRAESQ